MTPINKDPRHVEVQAEIGRLNAAVARIDSRLVEIAAQRSVAETDIQARQVSAALKFASTGAVVAAPTGHSMLEVEAQTLTGQRAAVLAVVADRRRELADIEGELSQAVCLGLVEQHKAIARRMVKVLQQLDAVQGEEEALLHEVERGGYSVRFTERVTWPHVGRLAQQSEAPLWSRLRELQAYAA